MSAKLSVKEAFMNIGRYQFVLWRHWAWNPYRAVTDAPLGYIYDRLGMYGPLEIRRFKARPNGGGGVGPY